MKKLILYLTICFSFNSNNYSQNFFGQWKDFLSYSNARNLIEVENKIFCTVSEGMFYFNKDDNTINNRLSKVNGLNDIGITAIAYNPENKIIIIGYESSNIDVIKGKEIINVSDIKRKQSQGSKTINHILIVNQKSYISCDFGIVELDLNKYEILNTYYIGENGDRLKVYETASDGINIYAATEKGLLKANLNNPNLIDYTNWSRLDNLPDNNTRFNTITIINNKIIVNNSTEESGTDKTYVIENNIWNELNTKIQHITKLRYDYDKLIVNGQYTVSPSIFKVLVFDEKLNQVADYSHYNNDYIRPNDAIIDKNSVVWIADTRLGLIKKEDAAFNNYLRMVPDGPQHSDVTDLSIEQNILWAAGDSRYDKWTSRGAYGYDGNSWTNLNNILYSYPEMEEITNISTVRVNPKNQNKIFAGSYGGGIIEIENNKIKKVYDENNSILLGKFKEHGNVEVSGMVFDNNDNLWISCTGLKNPIYVLKANGSLENLIFDYNGFGIEQKLGNIISTNYNHKWVVLEKAGLFVFDDEGNHMGFDIVDRENKSETNNIYALAEDLEGTIWVGTDKGIFLYYSPESIFSQGGLIAQRIIVTVNGNTGYLLGTEKINDIAIDAANRKWIATENSGVYLLSEDGTKQIYHFTAENDPLPSNSILSVAINHNSGEIFFGTSRGIVSYQDITAKGNDDFANVLVYPNPVNKNYKGEVVIKGLVKNTNIKITDIAGNLIYETTSLGGRAIWDGKNFSGRRANTGVYLIFCSNKDGSQTKIKKLLFIN